MKKFTLCIIFIIFVVFSLVSFYLFYSWQKVIFEHYNYYDRDNRWYAIHLFNKEVKIPFLKPRIDEFVNQDGYMTQGIPLDTNNEVIEMGN